MDAEQKYWIRVLLLDDVSSFKLTSASSFTVLNPKTQAGRTGFNRIIIPSEVKVSNGKITIAGRIFTDSQIVIAVDDPYIFNVNGTDYRGKLRLVLNGDRNSFDVVNYVPLEPYLAGVIGAEMPDYWEPSALGAQAIAARTYCLYIKKKFGSKRHWDVSKTQSNQVYKGLSVESPNIWNAVNQTRGQVLYCSHQDGSEDIFPTYYSSTCGGHTEDSKNVFGGEVFGPLSGVPCPYCRYVAKAVFFYWPMVVFNKKTVTEKLVSKYRSLKNLGEITKIIPIEKSEYGEFSRMTRIKLIGSTGKSNSLRAEDLRLTIDPSGMKLKSAVCKIDEIKDNWAFVYGRGHGHGVGMCQCGAQAMARQSYTPAQILYYYYPGSQIVSIY